MQVMILFPGEPFVGLDNYGRVVKRLFPRRAEELAPFHCHRGAYRHPLGVLIALFLQKRFFGSQLIRSIVLLPWVLPGAISAVLWIWVFHPSFEILNGLLRDLRHHRPRRSRGSPMPTAGAVSPSVVAHVWTQVPFAVVLLMAALSAISPGHARGGQAIDGRSAAGSASAIVVYPRGRRRWSWCSTVYNALTALTSYDLVYAMTGGGPGTATTLLSFQIWRESFSMYDFGSGSAVAFIVVAISAVLILAITRALPSDLFASD